MRNNASDALSRAIEKYRATAPLAAEAGLLPYRGGAKWLPAPFDGNSWWTGGFWPGLMWQLWAASKDTWFMDEAVRAEDLLTAEFRTFERLNHDVGFMYLLSCGARFKLTGDSRARVDALHAASLLMGRFNPAGFIRAWNEPDRAGYAIIDCLMNLSLLFWASDITGDPRFANVARIHLDTTLRHFLRPDGSVCHIVEFDPLTGARLMERAGQGFCPGSAWSRGQAWGLYGFALAHMNTGDARYLDPGRPDGLRFRPASVPGTRRQHRRGLRRLRADRAQPPDGRGGLPRRGGDADGRADRALLRLVDGHLRAASALHRQLPRRRRGRAHQHRVRRLLLRRGACD